MKAHDYTSRYWGHDFVIHNITQEGKHLHMMGWGHGISGGDYLLIPNSNPPFGANPETRYRVQKVRYCANPSDMWVIEATFAPRESAPGQPNPTEHEN